jgi:hypothetical protein
MFAWLSSGGDVRRSGNTDWPERTALAYDNVNFPDFLTTRHRRAVEADRRRVSSDQPPLMPRYFPATLSGGLGN